MVCASKPSGLRFVGCATKWTEGGQRGTHHRDLAACFAWKQVWPEDWRRRDSGWCMWHHHGGCVGGKLKTDGSMRWATSDPATLPLSFLMY
jgi:hypothetical protein